MVERGTHNGPDNYRFDCPDADCHSLETMNILQILIKTDSGDDFLASAVHESGKVQDLKVFPVQDGIVSPQLGYSQADLPDLTDRIEHLLTEI